MERKPCSRDSCAKVEFVVPPCYRFHPTKEEVLFHILLPAMNGEDLPFEFIERLEIYGEDKEPWKLFDHKVKEPFWVLTKLRKKHNGVRLNRVAGCGSWDCRQNGIDIKDGDNVIGQCKYFSFQCKHKTSTLIGHWVMHEYSHKDYDYAICKIKNKEVADKKRKSKHSDYSDSGLVVSAKRVQSDMHLRSNGDDALTYNNNYFTSTHHASSSQQVLPQQQYPISNSEERGEMAAFSHQIMYDGNGNCNGGNLNIQIQSNGDYSFDDSLNFETTLSSFPFEQFTPMDTYPEGFTYNNSYFTSTHQASTSQQVSLEQACYFGPNSNTEEISGEMTAVSHQSKYAEQQGNDNGNGRNLNPMEERVCSNIHLQSNFSGSFLSFETALSSAILQQSSPALDTCPEALTNTNNYITSSTNQASYSQQVRPEKGNGEESGEIAVGDQSKCPNQWHQSNDVGNGIGGNRNPIPYHQTCETPILNTFNNSCSDSIRS